MGVLHGVAFARRPMLEPSHARRRSCVLGQYLTEKGSWGEGARAAPEPRIGVIRNMELKQQAVAGTAESSDIMVTIDPVGGDTVEISLDSSVEKAFGDRIREVIAQTLKNLGVAGVRVTAVDKGALDCTVQARTIAAVYRAAGMEGQYDWKEIDAWNA